LNQKIETYNNLFHPSPKSLPAGRLSPERERTSPFPLQGKGGRGMG